MSERRRQKIEEYESTILALTHICLESVVKVSGILLARLSGVKDRSQLTLHHAEIFLVTTTLFFVLLIMASHYWSPVGWVMVVLGNMRIAQIIGLNLDTFIFDTSGVTQSNIVKRARWHFVALGFSFLDTVMIFTFMYQFFDARYRILNQHFSSFFDYLYYSVITIATIGYGDIYPVHWLGKLLAMYEGLIGIFFLVFFVSGALGRLHKHS